VQVTFRNRKLEKCYVKHKHAIRAWGDTVGRKYVERINLIQVAADLEELRKLPALKCHPLRGDREGQYAISLTGFYRLIFTMHGEHLEVVCVEEVSKHYDD
jgi:proteic killer suppression protein